MKSIILAFVTVLIGVESTSILPIDSSSSVNVKSNGNEYAYTIQENRGIPLEPLHVFPLIDNSFLKIHSQQKIFTNDLKDIKEHVPQSHSQEKLIIEHGSQLKAEGTENKGLTQGQIKLELVPNQLTEQKLEKPLEQLYIPGYPGYRLVPRQELQFSEYPYYVPYSANYAYHYPYIRFI